MSKPPDIGFIPSDIDGDSRNSRRERLKPRRRKITMNKIKSFIGLALCALALTAFTGCVGPKSVAVYKAEGAVITTVDTAMNLFADYAKAGRATQKQIDTVKVSYGAYYVAQQVAKAALEKYIASSSPGDAAGIVLANQSVTDAEATLLTTVNQILGL